MDRLTKELEKMNAPSTVKTADDRFWKLERDKSGNGSAVIRFLPPAEVDGDNGFEWARYFDHGFKGPTGKWYIENSLTSLGDKSKDPVGEFNSYLWNLSEDDNSPERKQARNQKRRLHYVSNILVISDPKHPENNGQVFLFKYGKKIFDKMKLLMYPEFEGDERVNPFDFWKGANFKIRIRTVDGYANYDQSQFDPVSPLFDGDDIKLEEIWKKQYSLAEFTDPKNYKTYDELKRRLDEVMSGDTYYESFMLGARPAAKTVPTSRPTFTERPATAAPTASKTNLEEDETPPFDMDDDDDELAAFKKLALGD